MTEELPTNLEDFGRKVALVRESRGLTREALATELGCGSKFTVEQIEAGKPADPEYLRKLPAKLTCEPPTFAALTQAGDEIDHAIQNRKAYGEAVKALRKSKSWSGTVLAEKAGCGVNTISKIENGQTVDIRYLHAVAEPLTGEKSGVQSVFNAAANMHDPMPEDRMNFGRSVTALRHERSLTMQQLGEKSIPACSDSTISRIESGDPQVNEKWLRAMAAALECTPSTMSGLMQEAAQLIEQRKAQGADPITGKLPPQEKEIKPPPAPKISKAALEKEIKALSKTPWVAITRLMADKEMDATTLAKDSGIPKNIIQDAMDGKIGLAPSFMEKIPPVFGHKTMKQLLEEAVQLPENTTGGGKADIKNGQIQPAESYWQDLINKKAPRDKTRYQ